MTILDYDADRRARDARKAVEEFIVLTVFLASLFGLSIVGYGLLGG
jgi:hypothetical protein